MWQRAAENLQNVLDRIENLKKVLKNVEIITASNNELGKIELGSTVRVVDIDNNKEKEYKLVNEIETEPPIKISINSPIGKALVGKRLHDRVEVILPLKTVRLKIIGVR
ncbi:MAG: hypothetical protein Kow0081_2170 [Candidatus Dojkabacteria bacterium]